MAMIKHDRVEGRRLACTARRPQVGISRMAGAHARSRTQKRIPNHLRIMTT